MYYKEMKHKYTVVDPVVTKLEAVAKSIGLRGYDGCDYLSELNNWSTKIRETWEVANLQIPDAETTTDVLAVVNMQSKLLKTIGPQLVSLTTQVKSLTTSNTFYEKRVCELEEEKLQAALLTSPRKRKSLQLSPQENRSNENDDDDAIIIDRNNDDDIFLSDLAPSTTNGPLPVSSMQFNSMANLQETGVTISELVCILHKSGQLLKLPDNGQYQFNSMDLNWVREKEKFNCALELTFLVCSTEEITMLRDTKASEESVARVAKTIENKCLSKMLNLEDPDKKMSRHKPNFIGLGNRVLLFKKLQGAKKWDDTTLRKCTQTMTKELPTGNSFFSKVAKRTPFSQIQ